MDITTIYYGQFNVYISPIYLRNTMNDLASHEVRLLRDTLSLSVDALNSDPGHLQMQLLGRLMQYITDTSEDR